MKQRLKATGLAGLKEALSIAIGSMDGSKETDEVIAWAGKATLQDKRVVHIGVYIHDKEKLPFSDTETADPF